MGVRGRDPASIAETVRSRLTLQYLFKRIEIRFDAIAGFDQASSLAPHPPTQVGVSDEGPQPLEPFLLVPCRKTHAVPGQDIGVNADRGGNCRNANRHVLDQLGGGFVPHPLMPLGEGHDADVHFLKKADLRRCRPGLEANRDSCKVDLSEWCVGRSDDEQREFAFLRQPSQGRRADAQESEVRGSPYPADDRFFRSGGFGIIEGSRWIPIQRYAGRNLRDAVGVLADPIAKGAIADHHMVAPSNQLGDLLWKSLEDRVIDIEYQALGEAAKASIHR